MRRIPFDHPFVRVPVYHPRPQSAGFTITGLAAGLLIVLAASAAQAQFAGMAATGGQISARDTCICSDRPRTCGCICN